MKIASSYTRKQKQNIAKTIDQLQQVDLPWMIKFTLTHSAPIRVSDSSRLRYNAFKGLQKAPEALSSVGVWIREYTELGYPHYHFLLLTESFDVIPVLRQKWIFQEKQYFSQIDVKEKVVFHADIPRPNKKDDYWFEEYITKTNQKSMPQNQSGNLVQLF